MPLSELVHRLRAAGEDPDARSLADAVWLAQWVEGSAVSDNAQGAPPWRPSEGRSVPSRGSDDGHAEQFALLDPPRVAPPRHVPPAVVPSRVSLSGSLDMQRALRPLQRPRGGTRSTTATLDEEATAQLRATTGITVPVFASATRRSFGLQLLFDSSSSMVVWEREAEELTQVFSQIGAFRDVRRFRLHEAQDGTLLVATGQGDGLRPRPAWSVLDPTSHTFTLVISDCAGPIWRSGAAQRFLHRLAAQRSPVAVLQPLPQRLWSRTALMPGPGAIHLRGQEGLECVFTPDDPPSQPDFKALAVPVLPPSPQALGRWARLLTGVAPTRIRGAAAWVRPDHSAVPAGAGRARAAHELVARFRADASPAAQRLATYLAAAPLSLPVMLLVQQAMMKGESGTQDLAEVLLGGLLSHANPAGTRGETWYDFAPGVQELLLEHLTSDEAALVLKQCSEYVVQHFGRGGPNFPALAVSHLTLSDVPAAVPTSRPEESPEFVRAPAPFAAVPAKVLRRFLPPPVPPRLPAGASLARARELISTYEREHDGWALVAASRLLQDLTAASQPGEERGEAEAELAMVLLTLYQLKGDPGLLDRSRHVVQHCLDLPDTATVPWEGTARLTLGRILREQARLRQSAQDSGGAEALLDAAGREFEHATWQLAPDTPPGLKAVLERADVLHDLWRLRGDQALLYEAVGALRALGGAQQFWAPHIADLRLQLGRVLLDLAGTTPERARRYAADAARELAVAREVLAAEPDGPARMAALLLDLARARELSGEEDAVVLRTLQEAEAATEFAPGMRARAALRVARAHRARSDADHSSAALRHAAEGFQRAVGELDRRDPERSTVLEEWGETLLDLAGSGVGADPDEVVDKALEVLGRAVRTTSWSDQAAAWRQLLLGRAFRMRFLRTDDITDLREAVAALDRSARATGPPGTLARAWYESGDALRELAWRTRTFALLHEAADHWHRAVLRAREAGDSELASLAEQAHHELREQLSPPARPSD
ncbi:SAV_2336 N-terminal domain-related protein [Streptomyces massasporeus]